MTDVDREQHEAFGKRANGRVWDLLGQAERTADEDRELVDA
ncbi:MAG: hypothetical protein JWL83_4716, partial [Actinomycetia bacterium]|nr:hypothetical protein [Actinomycetes bacterium]